MKTATDRSFKGMLLCLIGLLGRFYGFLVHAITLTDETPRCSLGCDPGMLQSFEAYNFYYGLLAGIGVVLVCLGGWILLTKKSEPESH